MIFKLAHNVSTESFGDAARLWLPTRRFTSQRRVRQLASASTHDERDALMRRWSADVIAALNMTVGASGLENVGAGPYVIVSLHEGLIDVPVLLNTLRLPMTFVARATLDDELPVKGLLDASGQIMINPEAPSSLRAMLRGAAQMAAQGRSIATFPQGSVLGIETAFQAGPRIVADHLGLQILPVAIWGSARAWDQPFSTRVNRGVPVRLEVLAPRKISSPAEYRALERELKAVALADPDVTPRRFDPGRDGYWDGFSYEVDGDYPALAADVASHRDAVAAP